jgi:hypothetical protein
MNVQLVIGMLFLAAALFFIGRRAYRSMSGKGNHGSCPDCAPLEKTKQEKVSN